MKPLCSLGMLALLTGAAWAEPPAPLDFNRDVRPILSAKCFSCHGPDPESRQADLRLDTPEGAAADLGGYAAIVPGKPDDSELLARIESDDRSLRMPPAKSGQTLTGEQKAILARWIAEGAKYDKHWSFRSLEHPEVPNRADAPTPIDAFVRERLAQAGLAPAPEADRYTLIRRASLDLTGLPPTLAEAEAFAKDQSPDAYEKLVDRLLASPRFGEHWARMWLDLARYADTKGYEKDQPRTIWRYRDWVIDAFNADMPFDRFSIEQLAGDLLPDPTESQILATAFHRNTMTNDEGGTDDEEFRIAAIKDRVDTTGQVWMGLTIGCAKCHTHKYDPITHRDYYSFFAVFNQTEDADRFDDAPLAPMPTADHLRRLAEADAKVKALREAFAKSTPEMESAQRDWERTLAGSRVWAPLIPASAASKGGATLAVRPDGSILASGAHPEMDEITLTIDAVPGKITALRLEALTDPSLPRNGPGRHAPDTNYVVSEFSAHLEGNEAAPIPLTNPRADFSQGGWAVAGAIDGKGETGWAIAPESNKPHVAVFDLAIPMVGAQGRLIVTIAQNYPRLQLGHFRVSATDADPATLKAEPAATAELAAIPREKRTPEQQAALDEAFRRQYPATMPIAAQIDEAEKGREAIRKEIPQTPICRELPKEKQRVTRIHQRGNFLDPGEEVQAAVPEAFGSLPAGAAANRLEAARWLVAKENPLTPRVTVNRFWARFFGNGLVETEEDFGLQGAPPSHPELLDWLAAEFRDAQGWSVKKLCKSIVMSATYRQASRLDPAGREADPRNVLLSRGPRFRMPAEVVRDQALAVSGLLSAKMHGPSVMPPQPPGLWKAAYSAMKWETSAGEDRYRRGLYTFWRRTSPYPAMTTFDAGSGEVCTIRRIRTNTPLQALVTLNDPAFVEAAAALGRLAIEEGGSEVPSRLDRAFRHVLIRPPSDGERGRLVALYESARDDFGRDPESAKALLTSANVAPGEGESAADLAAMTVVGNVLLNLDETVTKP